MDQLLILPSTGSTLHTASFTLNWCIYRGNDNAHFYQHTSPDLEHLHEKKYSTLASAQIVN